MSNRSAFDNTVFSEFSRTNSCVNGGGCIDESVSEEYVSMTRLRVVCVTDGVRLTRGVFDVSRVSRPDRPKKENCCAKTLL
jgi:hypothetical protein